MHITENPRVVAASNHATHSLKRTLRSLNRQSIPPLAPLRNERNDPQAPSPKPILNRVLLHLTGYRRLPIDPSRIYLLEADADERIIRTHRKKIIRNVRSLGEIEPSFQPHQFLRIHRNWMVNLRKIREIRQRPNGDGWQLRLQPPVNQVLSVSRTHEKQLWQAFEPKHRSTEVLKHLNTAPSPKLSPLTP